MIDESYRHRVSKAQKVDAGQIRLMFRHAISVGREQRVLPVQQRKIVAAAGPQVLYRPVNLLQGSHRRAEEKRDAGRCHGIQHVGVVQI